MIAGSPIYAGIVEQGGGARSGARVGYRKKRERLQNAGPVQLAARPARNHRLPHEGLGGRSGPAHQWKRHDAHHRSARRQSLEKELQGAAFDGTARHVWYFGATTSKLFGPLRLLPVALGMPLFHPISLMNTNKSAFGVNLGHMWYETDMIAGWMEILMKGVADGWVRPHVDKSFSLAQVGEAQTYLEERKNTGKVVLTT